jgi:hypothetical protein
LDPRDTSKLSTTETWLSRPKMHKEDKSGGSTKNHSPSRPRSTTNHGTSNPLVGPRTCRSGAPTHNGSRSSSIKTTNSSTPERTKRFSMSQVERMLKLNQLLFGRIMVERTRNGTSSILIKLLRRILRDLIKNTDSKSTDHSTSDQECQ